MNLLITGACGQTGQLLEKIAKERGCIVTALKIGDLDITRSFDVLEAVRKFKPTHIINAAAYNAVDMAEEEVELAFAVNTKGPKNIALAAKDVNAIFLHYSSDYVFDGTKETDYAELDTVNPISVYGNSKLNGERVVQESIESYYIVRTSWVYAPGGNNFVSRFVEKTKMMSRFNFINDQQGRPTYAADLANATLDILEKKLPFGIYHVCGNRACSPYEWACEVAKRLKNKIEIIPILANEYKTPAMRPKRSVLSINKLESFGIHMEDGISRLDDYFSDKSCNGSVTGGS